MMGAGKACMSYTNRDKKKNNANCVNALRQEISRESGWTVKILNVGFNMETPFLTCNTLIINLPRVANKYLYL